MAGVGRQGSRLIQERLELASTFEIRPGSLLIQRVKRLGGPLLFLGLDLVGQSPGARSALAGSIPNNEK